MRQGIDIGSKRPYIALQSDNMLLFKDIGDAGRDLEPMLPLTEGVR